jgi:RimJ/RimL family protein N-acetyltransferase
MIKLRTFKQKDKNKLLHILNDSNITKYLSTKIPEPYTSVDADWWISKGSTQSIIRAIEIDNELVGCIGVNQGEFEYALSGEIGYWLAKEYWRKGIMAQAVNQMVTEIFTSTEIVRLFASVFSENIGSMRLLEKCGFKLEAIHKKAIYKSNRFYDNHIFVKQK